MVSATGERVSLGKIGGTLLDGIGIHVEVPAAPYQSCAEAHLTNSPPQFTSPSNVPAPSNSPADITTRAGPRA